MMETGVIEETIIDKLTDKREEYSYNPGTKEYSKYLFRIKDEDIFMYMSKVSDSILNGALILFIDGLSEAMVININKPPARGIEEPQVETVIRGPREGFTESMVTNITLLRKKIKSTDLKMESFEIGRKTKTDITIAYLSTIANPEILKELRERLNKTIVSRLEFANALSSKTESPVMGVISTDETRGMQWVKGKVKSGNIVSPYSENSKITFALLKADSKVKPVVENGSVTIKIKIKTESNIIEMPDELDPMKNPKIMDDLAKLQSESIEKEVKLALYAAQKNLMRTYLILEV